MNNELPPQANENGDGKVVPFTGKRADATPRLVRSASGGAEVIQLRPRLQEAANAPESVQDIRARAYELQAHIAGLLSPVERLQLHDKNATLRASLEKDGAEELGEIIRRQKKEYTEGAAFAAYKPDLYYLWEVCGTYLDKTNPPGDPEE